MKKLCLLGAGVLALLALLFLVSRPPTRWSRVEFGMSRSNVYSLIGQPYRNNEATKSGVRWRSDAVVGRWEFDAFFRDETVAVFGRRWRWNWW